MNALNWPVNIEVRYDCFRCHINNTESSWWDC